MTKTQAFVVVLVTPLVFYAGVQHLRSVPTTIETAYKNLKFGMTEEDVNTVAAHLSLRKPPDDKPIELLTFQGVVNGKVVEARVRRTVDIAWDPILSTSLAFSGLLEPGPDGWTTIRHSKTVKVVGKMRELCCGGADACRVVVNEDAGVVERMYIRFDSTSP